MAHGIQRVLWHHIRCVQNIMARLIKGHVTTMMSVCQSLCVCVSVILSGLGDNYTSIPRAVRLSCL